MVDRINKTRGDHLITLEDPVELVHASQTSMVNQREVGAHTDSFASALRAALREDPDVVLVGEMRDLETVALALETANTGISYWRPAHRDGNIDRGSHRGVVSLRATVSNPRHSRRHAAWRAPRTFCGGSVVDVSRLSRSCSSIKRFRP